MPRKDRKTFQILVIGQDREEIEHKVIELSTRKKLNRVINKLLRLYFLVPELAEAVDNCELFDDRQLVDKVSSIITGQDTKQRYKGMESLDELKDEIQRLKNQLKDVSKNNKEEPITPSKLSEEINLDAEIARVFSEAEEEDRYAGTAFDDFFGDYIY